MRVHLGHRHPRLHAFVLGSLALHGLLFAAWVSSVRFGAEPRTALSVRLEGKREPAPSARTDRASRRQAERTERSHSHSVASPVPVATPVDGGSNSALATRTTDPGATGNADEVRARIESRLRLDLARHFDYPWIAQMRGWEGDVLLGVVVQASGRLDAVRVVRSSGFAVLDRSAVDSLKKVERLPEAVAWLRGRDIEMQLPILYRLKGER